MMEIGRWIDGDDGWDQVPDEKDAGGGGRRKGGNSMTGMDEWSSNAGSCVRSPVVA